jgi:hypothetical protein
MVRNGIDMHRWRKKHFKFNRPLRIGWVGATHWRSNDLEQLANFFGDYIDLRKLFFHHSGHNDNAPKAHELLGVRENRQSISQMVPILSYPDIFNKIDIGIVPLNNVPFNHAKSYIKGLEYAAAGIPFISSYSPEYETLAKSGIGRIARSADEWIYNLDQLLNRQNLLNEAEKNYSLLHKFSSSATGDHWDETFKFILENI